MARPDPGLEQQASVRSTLRSAGPVILVIGLILMAIALIDFFGSMNSMRMPTLFWMGFVGLPMIAVGWALTQAGFVGPASRYVAGEVTPTIRDAAGALGLGGQEACASCGAMNAAGARFCSSCGREMHVVCSSCGTDNEPEAKFCNRCGAELSTA